MTSSAPVLLQVVAVLAVMVLLLNGLGVFFLRRSLGKLDQLEVWVIELKERMAALEALSDVG